MARWISRALVLAIHERQLSEFGGLAGIRDGALLDFALARPRQLDSYGEPAPDLAALAASLAFGVARNHPFLDGNKRTSAVCCETFLRLNNGRLMASDGDYFLHILALAEGRLSQAEFAAWLRLHLGPKAGRLNEAGAAYRA